MFSIKGRPKTKNSNPDPFASKIAFASDPRSVREHTVHTFTTQRPRAYRSYIYKGKWSMIVDNRNATWASASCDHHPKTQQYLQATTAEIQIKQSITRPLARPTPNYAIIIKRRMEVTVSSKQPCAKSQLCQCVFMDVITHDWKPSPQTKWSEYECAIVKMAKCQTYFRSVSYANGSYFT